MNQLAPRTFAALVDIENDLTIELTSLEELVKYLPQGIEYKNRRNNTDIYTDVTYYLQQGHVIRSIRITEVVDEHYFDEYENICYLDTTVEGIDVNNGEELSIPLYKARGNTHLVSDFKSLFPTSVPLDVMEKLESYVLDPKAYSQETSPIKNIDELITELRQWDSLSRSVVLGSYCESIIETHEEYLQANFPQLVEAYKTYKNRKSTILLRELNLHEYIFLCENFITIGNEGEVEAHIPRIEDKRIEYLPKGPYYNLNCSIDRVEEITITSVYSNISWDCDSQSVILETSIEYITNEGEINGWSSRGYTQPPLILGNLYILIKPDSSRQEVLQAYKYPYSNKVEAPLDYPFKYMYPKC